MVWLTFVGCAAAIVFAAVKLAEYGDAIGLRTRLGGMFVGTLLLAGATSLPELLSNINAVNQGLPNLAAGNIFGSNMFNMFLLGLIGMLFWRQRILRNIATTHALTASLATLLVGLAVFFILANIDSQIGWVGFDSILIMSVYLVGVWLLRGKGGTAPPPSVQELDQAGTPGLRRALLGFGAATAVLVVVTPLLVRSSAEIAKLTGLGVGVGAALLGTVTSLPELVTTITAARLGAYDLAVGNLFGSNMFNMFALAFTDLFFTEGRFLGAIDPVFALAGLVGLLLTTLGLTGNLARPERRILFVEIDALLLVLGYLGGLYLLYAKGIGS